MTLLPDGTRQINNRLRDNLPRHSLPLLPLSSHCRGGPNEVTATPPAPLATEQGNRGDVVCSVAAGRRVGPAVVKECPVLNEGPA